MKSNIEVQAILVLKISATLPDAPSSRTRVLRYSLHDVKNPSMATTKVPIISININKEVVNKIIVMRDDGGSGSGSEGWVSNIKSSFLVFPKPTLFPARRGFAFDALFLCSFLDLIKTL